MTHLSQSPFSAQEQATIQRLLPPDLARPLAATDPAAPALGAAIAWLKERIDALGRFVPAPVARHHLRAPAPGEISGALWEGSLLFADLSGFTALSEHLASLGKEGSEEITRIINLLFSALVEEIELHGGDLIKFGGDALTAFFDAGLLGPEHAAWAAGAAKAMQAAME
ncbi:MAG TPA: adenylate/guanylate cyclase domain-containing protein, partial [Herpetosiphonaceae bacterium]